MGGEGRSIAFGQLLLEPVRNGIYKQRAFHGRGAKIVNMGELFAHPRLRAVPMKRVELSEAECKRFILEKGDLLFARRSLVAEGAGKCCVVLEVSESTTFESSIIRARPDPKRADSLFLYYFFNSKPGLHCLDTIRRQVAVAGITGSDLARLEIAVPPLPEQRLIAQILGTLDDKIDLNRRMNDSLEAMARALFKSWFVDFDPVHAKADGRRPILPDSVSKLFPSLFSESELGSIPDGWRVALLSEICSSIFSGGTPNTSTNEYWGGSIPWLSSGETRAKFILSTERTISPKGVRNSSTRLAPSFSTVIASAGQGNTRGQTSLLTFESYVNQSVVVLVHDPNSSSALHLFFDLERRYDEFRRISDGHSSRGSLTTKLLGDIPVVLPPIELILEFERLVAPIVRRAICGLKESQTLTRMRDALLPKLVTGAVRIQDAERIVSRVV